MLASRRQWIRRQVKGAGRRRGFEKSTGRAVSLVPLLLAALMASPVTPIHTARNGDVDVAAGRVERAHALSGGAFRASSEPAGEDFDGLDHF